MLGATACGGSSGTADLLTGVFLDSPVANLSYSTATVSGVTNGDGEFHYREGEIVVFSIGALALPMVVGAQTVTPLDMASTDSLDDPAVINLTRLLQTLDEDSDPSNGISIPDVVDELLADTAILDVEDYDVVGAIVEQVYMGEREPVSTDNAIAHFVETLTIDAHSEGNLEQRHFLVDEQQGFSGDTLFIDNDSFALQTTAGNFTGVWQEINGVYQLESEESTLFVSVAESDDQLTACIAASPQPVDACGGERYVVFDEVNQASLYEPSLIESSVVAEIEVAEAEVTEAEVTEVENAETQVVAVDIKDVEGADKIVEEADSQSTDEDLEVGAAQEAPEAAVETSEQPAVTDEVTTPETDAEQAPESSPENSDSIDTMDSVLPVPESESSPEAPTPDVSTPEVSTDEQPDSAREPTLAELFPACDPGANDDDGDGFGWPVVESPEVDVVQASQPVSTPTTNIEVPISEESMVATIEETEVLVPDEAVAQEEAVEQPDSAEVVETVVDNPDEPMVVNEPVVVTEPVVVEPVQSDNTLQPGDITDLIILTGQTNATATETAYDSLLDAGHERVFAFGDDLQWREADLRQNWDNHFPGNHSVENPDRDPYNNLVFQVGKAIANKSDRVVGIIMLTAPGEGISHWDYGSAFYDLMRARRS